jgi:hypothetical protein
MLAPAVPVAVEAAREVVQMLTLGVVQRQGRVQRVQNALRHPGEVASFQPGVVVNADASERGDTVDEIADVIRTMNSAEFYHWWSVVAGGLLVPAVPRLPVRSLCVSRSSIVVHCLPAPAM